MPNYIDYLSTANQTTGNTEKRYFRDKEARAALENKLDASVVGQPNGVASLDSNGVVPSSQLPSFVDSIVEVADSTELPSEGADSTIYVTLDNNQKYRWSGTQYVEISPSLALGETSSTAYRGDRGKEAYDHATETKLSTAAPSGLYKISATAEGHIASVTPVTKSDITGLGVPAQDTTYSNATSSAAGLMSSADKTKLDAIPAGATSNPGTVTSIATGVGLTGGPVTGSGTIKAKLKSENNAANASVNITDVADRQYAVTPDASGNLSVNVPWVQTTVNNKTGVVNLTHTDVGAAAASHTHTKSDLLDVTDNTTDTPVSANDGNLITARTLFHAGYTKNTGTVTSITAGAGLTGGTINSTGTIALGASGATPGNYGMSADTQGEEATTVNIPYLTVDQYGRITSILNRQYVSKNTTYLPATHLTDGLLAKEDKALIDSLKTSAFGECTTGPAVASKEITIDDEGWQLRKGNIVCVKYSYTNTHIATPQAPVTLNVNNTGEKQVWFDTSANPYGTRTDVYGYANRVTYYMYDGTYWVWLGTSAPGSGGGDTKSRLSEFENDVGFLVDTDIENMKGSSNGLASLDEYGKIPSAQLPSYVDDVLEYPSAEAFPVRGESGKIYIDTSTNLTYRWAGSTYANISSSLALGETESTAYRGDRGKVAFDHSQDLNRISTSQPAGLYKVGVTNEGHIASVSAVTKEDITELGIPGSATNVDISYDSVEHKIVKTIDNIDADVVTTATLKTDMALDNVDNTSDLNKPVSTATQTVLDTKMDASLKGDPYGVAELDEDGLVPEDQLPESVFNVVENATFAEFPVEGSAEHLYVDLSTNNMYRWDGNNYVSVSAPESIKYIQQSLTSEQKTQARTNIGAADAADITSINNVIGEIQATLQVYGDNVSDVFKTNEGIRIDYANGTSKTISLEADFPIKEVVYDSEHYLHFYDENGRDLFDNVYIEGGGGGGGQAGSVRITRVTNESIDCVFGASVPISFSVDARDGNDDLATINGSTWSVGGIIVARNIPVSQGNNTFDIGPYLNAGSNTVKVSVSADVGALNDLVATKTWRVNAVNMRFEWNYDDTQINTAAFTDTWLVYGDISKTSHTRVNGTELPTTTTTKTGATQSIQIPMQTHGAHGVERWLTATIGGIEQQTSKVYHEMIFAEAGNDAPIIAISKQNFNMNQYDTIQIPVVVYDPTSVLADATLLVDNVEIGTWDRIDRNVHYWTYTPTTGGEHVLAVRCGETTKTIVATVAEVEFDIEEVGEYTFRFKSSDFASNAAVKAWESEGINATFSENFDWINGGLHTETDENGNLQQYFCVKAGTTMTINHKLFSSDPKSRGMNYKMIFKTVNCRDYDAEIMHCYADVGLRMYAHNAILNSSGQSISVPYGEEEYIELEFDVYPVNGYRYMMAWIDGVITTCRVYDSNDNFVQSSLDQENIVIGSEDCDVYVYMVKAYPMLINRDGHIDNFIMDAPNAAEMARRYNRNDILTEGGDIDYTLLMEKNPDCRVWLYDIPYLTNSKDDKVKNCRFNQFWTNGSNYYQLSGMGTMRIQGTSSVKYIRGAANTDFEVTELEDGDGNNLLLHGVKDEDYGNNQYVEDEENPGHAKVFDVVQGTTLTPDCIPVTKDENGNVTQYIKAVGFKLSDNSVPITYTNTKVNFASCEQVNNMCNAIWYQTYNPYPSLTKRDCMEFNMGVQFIKDSGTVPDDAHFVLWGDNNYHMYSIANMGNSKKNIHVFHDLANPNEVCIEVNDNDKDQMRMIDDDLSEEDWSGKKFFGMRYPDTKNPSQEVRDAWQRLVSWMASRNPGAYTGEQLPNPETYENYTFRGHDRAGTQVLRGTTITQYAGTYTHDTFERRMARMLSECEDYMVMDSFVYHFVYLERHTMVDNVSKNNFWSSTDLIHWDLSKAYDMDTSDGNNNQGQMVFDYGNEYDDNIGGQRVFNGGDSVWFVFVANLYEACRTMFTDREAAGAWSATAYHNFLTSQQKKVPERCWNECYWYDYLRTYEDGISAEWMTFLDGGQKTHQRKHYEYFEELYDSAKYRGSASTSQNINFRAYTPNTYNLVVTAQDGAALKRSASASAGTLTTIPYGTLVTVTWTSDLTWRSVTYDRYTGYIHKDQLAGIVPKGEITIATYNKMYISMDVGTTAWAPIKAEKGVPMTIDFSSGGVLNNTLIVINTAPMIQSVSGVEQLYPDTCVFSQAIRLRELSIGSSLTGYENTFLRTLALDNNVMLENLYVQNLPNANSPLNLSNCSSLKYIDARGSGFTAYSFADGGLLSQAYLGTPTSLSMMNLAYLEDENFEAEDLSNLVSLRFENTPNVDSFAIVNSATGLQIARIIGIDWIMPNASTLNRLLLLQGLNEQNITVPQSVLAGDAYAPSMRVRNLQQYAEAWPNLDVTYDNIVEEFPIRFYNPDGTTVKDRAGASYIQYVDRGQTIIDPVTSGEIPTPTMDSTAQYDYTFTGWQNITGVVMSERDVIATYSSTTRTYRVRWFSQTGTVLKTVQVPYGSEAIYQDSTHTFPPVKTDNEENLYFAVFKNWDKSTGYVTEDIDVYAVWDQAPLPTAGSKTLDQMTIAEIYGVAKTNQASSYFEEGDFTDIEVGRDFDFDNVTSRVLLEERYFDGTGILKMNDVKLFDADAPSFTLAIDYEFCENTSGAGSSPTLVACCDPNNSADGFRIQFTTSNVTSTNQGIQVLWGDRSEIVAHGTNRGIIVLRHRKGSNNLLIASDNGGRYVQHNANNYGLDNLRDGTIYRYDAYNSQIHFSEIPRAQATETDGVLTFGAMAYGSQGFAGPAKGWIHWCKVWYDDLGDTAVRELASWPHETWRMHYRGHGLYNKDDGTGLFDGASFIANAPLSQYYEMYSTATSSEADNTGGWKNSLLREFVNSRCFNALPYGWQSIVRPVRIATKGANDNPNALEYTSDKIYIPSAADLTSSSTVVSGLISSESRQISWFVDNGTRLKFIGINLPDDYQIISATADPTLYDTYHVKEGDVWIDTNDPTKCYVFVPASVASKHVYYGGRYVSDMENNIQASNGGLWVRSKTYWTRTTPVGSQRFYNYTVYPSGSVTSTWIMYHENQRRGVVLMFSI